MEDGIDYTTFFKAEYLLRKCSMMRGEVKTLDEEEKKKYNDALAVFLAAVITMSEIAGNAQERFQGSWVPKSVADTLKK